MALTLTQWESRVSEAYSIIRASKCTHEESIGIIDRKVYDELNSRTKTRSRYTGYVRGYVSGLMAADRALLWKEVEFCYFIDGEWHSVEKNSTRKTTEAIYTQNRGCELGACKSGHLWRRSDRAYTGS